MFNKRLFGALIWNVCWLTWGHYSHHGRSQASDVTSLNTEWGDSVQNPLSAAGQLGPSTRTDGPHPMPCAWNQSVPRLAAVVKNLLTSSSSGYWLKQPCVFFLLKKKKKNLYRTKVLFKGFSKVRNHIDYFSKSQTNRLGVIILKRKMKS